jgi:hypothetical protein
MTQNFSSLVSWYGWARDPGVFETKIVRSADDQFEEPAAIVGVELDGIAEVVFGQERQVGRVQALHEVVAQVGDRQRLADGVQPPDPFGEFPQGNPEGPIRAIALPGRIRGGIEMPQESDQHVVDVHQLHFAVRVVDGDLKPTGEVVAEGGDHGVVVVPGPLSENPR